jgi:dipeptidyl aminopeptidase/acylaminoacyl peptidase
LPATGTNTFASSWSADSTFLVFSQTGVTSRDDLWLQPLNGERKPKLFKQTPFNEANGKVSPDGRWMAYNADSSGQFEVYIESMAAGGAQRQISVAGGGGPRWRSDGRELYFISDRKLMAVDIKPGPELGFGAPHELFRETNFIADIYARTTPYQPSANGSQFLALLSVGDAPTAPPLTVVTNWQSAYAK